MNLNEYNMILDELIDGLEKKEVNEDIIKRIKDLYDYKPVSTKWHYLNCRAMFKRGKEKEIIEKYRDMISYEYNYKYNAEIWQILIDSYCKVGVN